MSNDTGVSPHHLNTGQSFGDIISDPSQQKIDAARQRAIENAWDPMGGTFNVVQGSQLHQAMEEIKA